jgi:predicted nucleic acid-binding protein
MIVLDASVVLKRLFDDEAGAEPAPRWKDAHAAGHEIVAVPDLLFSGIGNVLATTTRLSEAAIAEAISLLWKFSLERFDLGSEEFQGSLALSRKCKNDPL